LFTYLFQGLLRRFDILLSGFLRFLLKGMQDLNGLFQLRDRNDPIFPLGLDANLLPAGAN